MSLQGVEWTKRGWGEREIEAVTDVLRNGTELQIGDNVRAMEAEVPGLMDKPYGVMVNSGTSALYIAVELLDLPPGSEVITTVLTFSATVAPIVRAGLVPAFVDVELDTYNVDVDRIEEMITPRTKALIIPNLIGNVPEWPRIREIADRHGLRVVEDTADTLGAKLHGKSSGTWSDISITSFAQAHIVTCGSGGLVAMRSEAERDRALLLRRWGRRCETQLFGSREGETRFEDVMDDGLLYDTFVIFDEVGWNFEPNEMAAAFGRVQVSRLPEFYETRLRNFTRHGEFFKRYPEHFIAARQTDDLETSWICYPAMVHPEGPLDRTRMTCCLEERGVHPKMAWSGNITRQPAFQRHAHRVAPGGYPNADRVMENTVTLPMGHTHTLEEIDYIHAVLEDYIRKEG